MLQEDLADIVKIIAELGNISFGEELALEKHHHEMKACNTKTSRSDGAFAGASGGILDMLHIIESDFATDIIAAVVTARVGFHRKESLLRPRRRNERLSILRCGNHLHFHDMAISEECFPRVSKVGYAGLKARCQQCRNRARFWTRTIASAMLNTLASPSNVAGVERNDFANIQVRSMLLLCKEVGLLMGRASQQCCCCGNKCVSSASSA